MFRQILVPTDLSPESQQALEIAVEIATLRNGTIYFIHVIKLIPHSDFEEFKDFYARLEDQAVAEMDAILANFEDSHIRIEPEILYGNRVEELLKFTDERQIDLIVMNSHKVDLENPTRGWGTISYKVGALSPCPIMLVK